MKSAAVRLVLAITTAMATGAACGGDGTPADDAGVPDADVSADATDTSSDATSDTGSDGSGDTAGPDSSDAADAPPEPECDEPLRPVGALCRKPFDRACIDDADCRETEECVWKETDTLTGTCIYTPAPPLVCPGAPGCAAAEGATFRAGFAVRDITPRGWEFAREGFAEDFDEWGMARQFVGDVSDPRTYCDCGRDMICPPGEAYADCFSAGEWTGPDADGTEEDGYMQGNWMAGFVGNWNANLCPEAWLGDDCEGVHCCVDRAFHDPLWARGAVMDFGNTRVAFVTVDAVGYFYEDGLRHLAAFPEEWGIDHLMMSSTHNHQGTDTMGKWGPGFLGESLPTDSGRVDEWLDEVHLAIVDVVGEAIAALEPADVYVAQFRTPREEFALYDYRDPYVAADVATAVRVVRAGEAPSAESTLGVWLNWHNHVESIGGSNRVISADFPHWMRLGLEQGLPATELEEFPAREPVGGVTIFVAGAVGGLMTPLETAVRARTGESIVDNGYAKAQAIGERLADATAAVLSTPCPDDETRLGCYRAITPTLEFATSELLVDVENVLFQAGAIDLDLFDRGVFNWRRSDGSGLSSSNLPKMLTSMTQLRMGPITWQTFPGEPFPELFTGFDFSRAEYFAQIGRIDDVNCAEDRVTRLEVDVEPRFACVLKPENPAPPAIDDAPDGPGLFDTLPGEIVIPVGNGMDAIGYLIPSYDFVVHPDIGVLVSMPGDHYEEEVSAGDVVPEMLELVDTLTQALDAVR